MAWWRARCGANSHAGFGGAGRGNGPSERAAPRPGSTLLLPAGSHGVEVWLVKARDVKHLPGRPKTDRLDAVWLCKVAERQMLRPSFVPPPAIRRLRDPGPLPRRS